MLTVIGVMGENGRGTVRLIISCLGQVSILLQELSVSLSDVSVVLLPRQKKLIQYLRYYADSNVFSAAITLQVVASSLKALEHIQTRPEIRKKLWTNVNYLRK